MAGFVWLLCASTAVPKVSENDQACQAKGHTGTILREGTVITFELYEPLKSGDTQVGSTVQLSVYRPIVVDGKTLVNEGRYGQAKVRKAQRAGGFGRPGILTVEAINVEAVDGSSITLTGEPLTRIGRDRRSYAWAFLVFGALVRGSDVEIPSRTILRGLVQHDVVIKD